MNRIISLFLQKILFKLFGSKSKLELDKIHNKNKGQTCYAFGDGVSLKYIDLNSFKGQDIIAGNNFILHNLFNSLSVKYYIFYQPFWFYPVIRIQKKVIINHMFLTIKRLIKNNCRTTFFSSITNISLIANKNLIFLKESSFNNFNLSGLTNKFNCFEGTLRLQILMAIYLGYKEIILVGHDYTHSPSHSGHFYEYGVGEIISHDNWNVNFFNEASKYISIKTTVVNSSSNRLETINYDGKIDYKENHEIVSKKYLEKMNKFFYYNIY